MIRCLLNLAEALATQCQKYSSLTPRLRVLLCFKNTFSEKFYVLQIYNIKGGFGGGSVIDGNWILSAAHVFNQFRQAKKSKNWKDYFHIVVGKQVVDLHFLQHARQILK